VQSVLFSQFCKGFAPEPVVIVAEEPVVDPTDEVINPISEPEVVIPVVKPTPKNPPFDPPALIQPESVTTAEDSSSPVGIILGAIAIVIIIIAIIGFVIKKRKDLNVGGFMTPRKDTSKKKELDSASSQAHLVATATDTKSTGP